jgi:DNA processing protein
MSNQDFPIIKLSINDYPKSLLEIPEIPKQLYMRGNRWDPEHKLLCIVGSRSFTQYGKQALEKLVAGLAGFPITIVSGLAMGIDALAHQAAMKSNLGVIAIPGSGIDENVIYPRTNRKLAREILEYGGCIISEFEPTDASMIHMFPRRNRIMAGLSHAVLIIEAEIKSGTLITARLATEYSKDVLTVPGSIFSLTSEGPHMLLTLGATPIRTSKDILDALHLLSLESPDTRGDLYKGLSKEEKMIVEALREPLRRDELIKALGIPASDVLGLLMMLEIKGLIKEELGEIRLL